MSSILKVDEIQNTGGTTGLTIDNAGRLLKPVIPFGQASLGASAISSGAKITLDNNISSGGGLTVDQTNERMIVPVAGLYAAGFHHLTDSNTNTVSIEMRKNGTRIDGSRTQTKGNTYIGLSVSLIISLEVSDYIEWWSDTGIVHNNHIYNNMYVYLIG
jgi:hypothetical protein